MIESFQHICEVLYPNSQTFFPQTRGGNTAVGHTLETSLFNKKEDNLKSADIGDAELKGSTGTGSKRVRLATSNCGAETDLLSLYGVMNKAQTKRQFYPLFMLGKPKRIAGKTALLGIDYDQLTLHFDDALVGGWKLDSLAEMIIMKLRNIAVVEAEKKEIGGIPHFRYHAVKLYNGLCVPNVLSAVERGAIKVEFRINEEHDHGTSFNSTTKAMEGIYNNYERVVF